MPIVERGHSESRTLAGRANTESLGMMSNASSGGTAETSDAFLGGAVAVLQPTRGYRAGLDAVLLAAVVPTPQVGQSLRLLDVGAGVGVVGLCAAVRLPSLDVTLVEQSEVLCGLAERNIAANGLQERARVIRQDVLASRQPVHPQLADNSFDIVVSNPPYYEAARHRRSPSDLKADSHSMPVDGLDGWFRFMARMTRPGGRGIIIHRAEQLPDLLSAMTPRFGNVLLQPLHPRRGQPASRVMLTGVRGSRAPMHISPGLILHGEDNRFTPEVDKVLKTPTELNLI